jgi:hypothetical protein
MKMIFPRNNVVFMLMTALVLMGAQGCATRTDVYRDTNMDFGSIKTLAVMPLANDTRDQLGSDRVRDVLVTDLLATSAVYVLPIGELARGIVNSNIANPSSPSVDEIVRLCKIIKADAVITGTLREYGEIRSSTAVSDVVSLSLQLIEGQTGRVVWSASTTEGGVSVKDRLLGGGGNPINDTTEKAVNDLLTKLFQ